MYKGVVTGIAFEASQTNAEATADLGNLTTLMEDGALAAVVSWLIPDRANAPVDLKIEQIGFRTKEGGAHAEVSFKDVAGVGVELKHVSELYLPDVVKGWLTKKVFSSNLGIVMFVQYSNGTTRYPATGTTPLLIAIDNVPQRPGQDFGLSQRSPRLSRVLSFLPAPSSTSLADETIEVLIGDTPGADL